MSALACLLSATYVVGAKDGVRISAHVLRGGLECAVPGPCTRFIQLKRFHVRGLVDMVDSIWKATQNKLF